MFRDDSDPSNPVYTYTGRIAANCYFKFCPEEALGTYKMYCDKGDGQMSYEENAGGAFYNATEGYKTITINAKDMTYTITDFDMKLSVPQAYAVLILTGWHKSRQGVESLNRWEEMIPIIPVFCHLPA